LIYHLHIRNLSLLKHPKWMRPVIREEDGILKEDIVRIVSSFEISFLQMKSGDWWICPNRFPSGNNNSYGNAGVGHQKPIKHAKKFEPQLSFDESFVFITTSGTCSFGLTASGRCFGWGRNDDCKLGIESPEEFITEPREVDWLRGMNIQTISSFIGGVVVIDSNHHFFGWGSYVVQVYCPKGTDKKGCHRLESWDEWVFGEGRLGN